MRIWIFISNSIGLEQQVESHTFVRLWIFVLGAIGYALIFNAVHHAGNKAQPEKFVIATLIALIGCLIISLIFFFFA